MCSKKKTLKHSYHIILSNYYCKDLFDTQMSIKLFAMENVALGFDPLPYEKNQHVKAINQSKWESPKRVQAYIEGSRSLTKHLILHDFDKDAVDVSIASRSL